MTDTDLDNLTDEEFMQLEDPVETPAVEEDVSPSLETEENNEETEDEAEEETSEEVVDESDDDTEEVDTEEESATEDTDTTASVEDESEDKTTTEKEPDYKSQLDEVMAPFRANNRDIKVDSIADVRQLMQMGANYNKKMAILKPNLKLMKMLENNELLDENKLSYLIDLDKKNPEAIAKLIAESDFDPLSVGDTTEYKPNTYTVDDRALVLDDVLDAIQGSKGYEATVDIISNKMDEASKTVLFQQPDAIRIINEHVELGIYDQITAEVDKQRMLGKLTGLSDIAAYKTVGDQMYEAGAFNDESTPAEKPSATSTKKNTPDPKLKERKRAASTPKSTPSFKKQTPVDFNPLGMSDEDFEKEMNGKLL